jgi:hypothetical protein
MEGVQVGGRRRTQVSDPFVVDSSVGIGWVHPGQSNEIENACFLLVPSLGVVSKKREKTGSGIQRVEYQ